MGTGGDLLAYRVTGVLIRCPWGLELSWTGSVRSSTPQINIPDGALLVL